MSTPTYLSASNAAETFARYRTIVFIDSGVEQPNVLAQGVIPGAEVHLLSRDADAIAQITTTLAGRSDLGSVHVLSHGAPGHLLLGNRELHLDSLNQNAELLKTWFAAAAANAPELLLYGCNVAAGEVGQEFLAGLQQLVGVPVAAASHPVGSSLKGGQWQLDQGNASAPLALTERTLADYVGVFSFTPNGFVSTDFANGDDAGLGIGIDADGKIVVVGKADTAGILGNDFAIARYNSDGTLDTSFGSGGKVSTNFNDADDAAYAVAFDASGNLLVAGSAKTDRDNGHDDFALVRYTSAGVLDTTFGTNGTVVTDFDGGNDKAFSVTTDASGKILVAGSADSPGVFGDDFAIVRYNADGTLDTTFGTGGKVVTNFNNGDGQDQIWDITTDAAGNILVSGHSTDANSSTGVNFAIARYTSDGVLDTTFDGDGRVLEDFAGNDDYAWSITANADGSVRVGGYINNGNATGSDFASVQYTSTGALDTSYGTNGKVTSDFFNAADYGQSITKNADGDLLIAGNQGGDFRLVLVDLDPVTNPPTPTPTSAAIAWDTISSVVSTLSIDTTTLTASLSPIGRTIVDTNWELQTTGDLNGDGQADVILRHAIAGQNLAWYMNPGGQSIASEALFGRDVPDTNWSISGTGDLDGDGNVDVILRNQSADQIVAWYMDGSGNILSEGLIGRGFGDNNWKIEAMADFNGDGKSDILLRNGLAGQNVLWEMDGPTILAESTFGRDVPDVSWQIEGASDFDNNGTIDVLMRQVNAGQALLWSMSDKNTIGSELLVSNVPTATSQIVF